MMQPIEKVFQPTPIIRFPPDVAREWQKKQISWTNNGWNWPGNAYLVSVKYKLAHIKPFFEEEGVDWEKYATYEDGYSTSSFGFATFDEIYTEHWEMGEELEICAKLMDELGIGWCGWPQAPSFTVAATQAQITQLYDRLQEPIRAYRAENGFDDAWAAL